MLVVTGSIEANSLCFETDSSPIFTFESNYFTMEGIV